MNNKEEIKNLQFRIEESSNIGSNIYIFKDAKA
jgi:hypothetical protein